MPKNSLRPTQRALQFFKWPTWAQHRLQWRRIWPRGPELHGKKIVISFSPATFTMSKLPPEYYAGNFSPLHAYEMIFSPYLSITLKIDSAKRMLAFPETLQNDSFLQFAIIQMTRQSKANRFLYYLSWPLGEFQIAAMRLQDHAEVALYLWSHPTNPNVQKIPHKIDWSAALSYHVGGTKTAYTEQLVWNRGQSLVGISKYLSPNRCLLVRKTKTLSTELSSTLSGLTWIFFCKSSRN